MNPNLAIAGMVTVSIIGLGAIAFKFYFKGNLVDISSAIFRPFTGPNNNAGPTTVNVNVVPPAPVIIPSPPMPLWAIIDPTLPARVLGMTGQELNEHWATIWQLIITNTITAFATWRKFRK